MYLLTFINVFTFFPAQALPPVQPVISHPTKPVSECKFLYL